MKDTIPEETPQDNYAWQNFLKIFLKTTALSFVFVFIFLLLTAIALGIALHQKLSAFEKMANVNRDTLYSYVKDGWNTQPKQTDNRINILILGLDTLANRGDVQPLTDTMLIASLHLDSGEVHLLSLPRDLWSEAYKTKINALYSYGKERYPAKPEQFSTEVISQVSGIPLHHTLVISLDSLAQLIDTVGGITVDVPTGFKDEMFPRSDVDVTTVSDPTILYKTIEFQAGTQDMNGSTALEYIRSRHSTDNEGTDTARATRQQLVIKALATKIVAPDTLKSTEKTAQLFLLYQHTFSTYITIPEVISIAKSMYPYRKSIIFYNENLFIFPEKANGSIVHPPEREYDNQWVYTIKDELLFKNELQTKLLQNEVNQVEYKES